MECKSGFILDESTKSCVVGCPGGTVEIKESKLGDPSKLIKKCKKCGEYCSVCSSATECARCSQDTYILPGVGGVNTCDPCLGHLEFTKITLLGVCHVCHQDCQTCFGPYANNCISCKDPKKRVNYFGECILESKRLSFASGMFIKDKKRLQVTFNKDFV